MSVFFRAVAVFALSACAACMNIQGQGATSPAWLRYAIPPDPPRYHDMPHAVVLLGDAPEEKTAADELDRGLGHMVAGTDHLLHRFDPRYDAIVLGTSEALRRVRPRVLVDAREVALPEEAYRIRHVRSGARQWWVLEGGSPRAELYAAFRFAALVAEDRQLPDSLTETARVPLRALELRGDPAAIAADLPRLARLMASVGLNGLLLDGAAGQSLEEVAAAVRPYGVRVWFRGVRAEAVAGFGGVLMDADADLKRLPATVVSASAAARVLRHAGGSVLLEGAFEPAWKTGIAAPDQRSAVLANLDPNVVVMSAAVPFSMPLAGLGSPNFGLLPGMAQAATFDLFPGGGRALVFPAALWETVLATPEKGVHEDSTLRETLSHKGGGVVAVAAVDDLRALWGQPLLAANLFGFGRVAWNATEPAAEIADAWARQTFGDDARVFAVAKDILLRSTDAFMQVSSPMGLPWLGEGARPDPARSARRAAVVPIASSEGVGVDRDAQLAGYPAAFAAELSDPARCPEPWLLSVQRVPPQHRLHDGKTVVQAFYDAHFAGAAQMNNATDAWEETKGLVDTERFVGIHDFLLAAARRGETWRDSTTGWMERATGVQDEPHFVGDHPGRVEAEMMTLTGYLPERASEAEDASNGGYTVCRKESGCSAATVFHGEATVYRVEVGYFGTAKPGTMLELQVNGMPQGRWAVEYEDGAPGSATAERFAVNGVRLRGGDRVSVEGTAALDFVDVTRDPRWN